MSKARWRHLTVAREAIVANVNMDEDEMLWPLEHITEPWHGRRPRNGAQIDARMKM
jgi:hypothetical protein